MYLSISPKLRKGWTKEYGLYRAALETAAEESTGTWDPDLKTLLPSEMDDNSKKNMKILEAKVIGLNFIGFAKHQMIPDHSGNIELGG